MPIYDFVCAVCGATSEHLVPYEASPPACMECGGPTQRAVSRANPIFKGPGWYKTDRYGLDRKATGAKNGDE